MMMTSFSASLIVKAAYGYDIEGEDDPLASLAIEATDLCFVEGAPGGSMVDVYPARKWVILSEWIFSHMRSEIHSVLVSRICL